MTDDAPLPPRPRRRTVTPAGAVLAAVLLAALGFLGGVQVQKSRADSTTTGNAAGRFPGRTGTGSTGTQPGGQQQVDATIGSVSSVDGTSFYVSDQSGNKVKVKTNKQSKVTRSAVAGADEIHPGDTVIVQGAKADSGTVTASSVVATASNAQGGFGALFGGGAGGAGGGGAAAGGGAPTGGFGGGGPQGAPPGGG